MIRHRKFVYLVLLSIVGGIIAVSAITLVADKTSAEAQLMEFKTHYDFGPVYLKEQLEHTFKLVNPFDEVLRVTKVRHTCGCSVSKLGTSQISPRGSTTLKLSIRVPNKPGEIQVMTLVSAETDKTQKQTRSVFVIDAQPTSVIEVNNSYPFIQLGQFQLDDIPIRKTLTVTKGKHPIQWELLKCRSKDNNIDVTLVKTTPEKWNLELQLKNTDSFGNIRDHLEFSFWKNGKPQPYRLIKPVEVEIAGHILPSPKSILIGAIRAGGKVEKNIRLVNIQNNPQPIEIISVSCTDANEVEAKIIREGSEQVISAVFTASRKQGTHSGSITIQAKTDKVYQIVVRYLAFVLQ